MAKSLTYRVIMMLLALVLAGFSQALMIISQLGATIWTAAGLNLIAVKMQTVNLNLINQVSGLVMILLSLAVGLVNWWLTPNKAMARLLRNLCFVVPFSYLIQGNVWLCQLWLPVRISTIAQFILNICGMLGISLAISLYQRANVLLHPYDDLAFIIRYRFCHGNMMIAQLIGFAIPAILVLGSVIFNYGRVIGIGWGTTMALVFQGPLVQLFDCWVLPTFKHQNLFMLASKS